MKIALFGQAPLAVECFTRLREAGHEVVGVFAPPEVGRSEPLGARALEAGVTLVRRRHFQTREGAPIAAALAEHAALGAELNVLASLTSFLPAAITDAPVHGSLCFHPSLLPRFRGGNALQWQIILGEPEVGVSVFVPDEGVDTGPVVVQKGGVRLDPHETTGSLFFKKLCPLGVEAMLEAVDQVDRGTARPREQDESRATYQGLVDERAAAIDLGRPALEIDRLVRGCDPQPGAHLKLRGTPLRLYEARLEPWSESAAPGTVLAIGPEGMTLALEGGRLCVGRVRAGGGKEAPAELEARGDLRPGERLESAVREEFPLAPQPPDTRA